jgi:cytochrome P450
MINVHCLHANHTEHSKMAVTFDPYSREYFADPYPIYKRLRDEAPVFHNPERNFWALSRYEDVLAAHKDVKRFLSSGGITIEGQEAGTPLLIVKDGPEHAWHKSLVTKVFSRARMAALEPYIRQRTVQLLEAAAMKPEFDFVKEFSVILPLDVISQLLDIPEEWREEYHHNVNDSLARGDSLDASRAGEAQRRIFEVFMRLVQERRASPRDDVITMLLQTEVKDEDGAPRKLEDFEVAVRFNEMGAAGHETTAKAITNGAMAFARFPDQKRLLADNRALLPKAVNEILRLEPPSQMQGRTTSTDVAIHGVTIPQAQKVMLLTGSASRDERVFPDPDRFDITREADTRSLHFGFGVHKCLGIHLAILEITIAFEELFSRYPDFEVIPEKAEYPVLTNVRGPSALPGRLGRHA